MILYVAPHMVYKRPLTPLSERPPAIFLAGGISGCPTWQDYAVARLRQTDLIVLNPRRPEYKDDKEEGRKQIRWERFHMEQADLVLFWFPKETDCPITLFEFGTWIYTRKNIWVGTHPEYRKRFDVEEQYQLADRDGDIADDLDKLLDMLCQLDEDHRYYQQLQNHDEQPTPG